MAAAAADEKTTPATPAAAAAAASSASSVDMAWLQERRRDGVGAQELRGLREMDGEGVSVRY